MKAIKGLIAALLLSAPLLANAYWEQTLDFNPNPLITPDTFTHDLTQVGFNPLSESIDGYNLTLNIRDEREGGTEETNGERVLFTGFRVTRLGDWISASVTVGDTLWGLAKLNEWGQLTVTVSSDWGDFYLESSTLRAWSNSTSVPEPSNVALLAAGLFGIATMRRSAARKG